MSDATLCPGKCSFTRMHSCRSVFYLLNLFKFWWFLQSVSLVQLFFCAKCLVLIFVSFYAPFLSVQQLVHTSLCSLDVLSLGCPYRSDGCAHPSLLFMCCVRSVKQVHNLYCISPPLTAISLHSSVCPSLALSLCYSLPEWRSMKRHNEEDSKDHDIKKVCALNVVVFHITKK